MSNIYIQEPPTHGKVLLKTTAGEIDIELWSKEAQKHVETLCSYYDGTIFHRVVPDFIIQGGDPSGTGEGGESVYGHPFKTALHSPRVVAMANAGPHDNGSQFFFTLARADELNNKHTIFGKVTGDTVYNMLRLAEVECDCNERPLKPHKIRSTEVLSNPFDDIVPRETKNSRLERKEEVKKSQSKATKNFSLLSFGEEAEEEEEATNQVTQTFKGKSKSSHDLLKDDPKLSSVPAVESTSLTPEEEERLKAIANKLKKDTSSEKNMVKEDQGETSSRRDEIRKEVRQLKKEILAIKQRKDESSKPAEETKEGKLGHVLQFDEQTRKVKDANMQDEDTFEIYDPRNPVNKRRREESKKIMKEKKAKR
ncbi:hypothetical protein WMY93_020841 [Mugilogobius chulae]|uniref:Spliceosome-associated protein CWC27 homolog n=1 Tax=Mugilogobius chulae TaxID=88201 RepID=A0AAW0NET6_9GOBI